MWLIYLIFLVHLLQRISYRQPWLTKYGVALSFVLSDLNAALCALGYRLNEGKVEELTTLLEVDDDTTLDFSEFCLIVEHIKEERGPYGELRWNCET